MDAEKIITAITCALSSINVLGYMILTFKRNKTEAKATAEDLSKKIPGYVSQANAIFGSNNIAKVNYVLALLNSDCQEHNLKYKESKYKTKVQDEVKKTNEVQV